MGGRAAEAAWSRHACMTTRGPPARPLSRLAGVRALAVALVGALLLGAAAPAAALPRARVRAGSDRRRPDAAAASSHLSFYEIAQKHHDEKVYWHSYQDMYEKYLEPRRAAPMKMLEIGLGCVEKHFEKQYGPGRSFAVWREYLPSAALNMLEYNGECARAWAAKVTGLDKLYVGSQDDPQLLQQVVDDARASELYDVIIDDGSHQYPHIMASLLKLWDVVKPGGHYIVEDMEVAYMDNEPWKGGKPGTPGTIVSYMKDTIDRLNCKRIVEYGYKDEPVCRERLPRLLSMDCFTEACVFTKAKPRPAATDRPGAARSA